MRRTGYFWVGMTITCVALWLMPEGPTAWAVTGIAIALLGIHEDHNLRGRH